MIGQYQNKMTVNDQIMAIMYLSALPKPVATMSDCFYCRHVDIDQDDMADSCDLPAGKPCVRSDRRSPWGMR